MQQCKSVCNEWMKKKKHSPIVGIDCLKGHIQKPTNVWNVMSTIEKQCEMKHDSCVCIRPSNPPPAEKKISHHKYTPATITLISCLPGNSPLWQKHTHKADLGALTSEDRWPIYGAGTKGVGSRWLYGIQGNSPSCKIHELAIKTLAICSIPWDSDLV